MSADLIHEAPCSVLSARGGEPLFATAPDSTSVWLLLEYPKPWGSKALKESNLPVAVKRHLEEALAAIPGSRLQLIKRPAPPAPDGLAFYVVLAREDARAVHRFSLGSYEELLGLDLAAVAAGGAAYRESLSREPLYLVCTNARRDQCCGRLGSAVYRTLAAHAGGAAWQTTHLGGHRFAATLVCLPEGVCYGRVGEREAGELVGAHARGEIYRLDRYRGLCFQVPEVQAAEYFLRERTGALGLRRFVLAASEQVAAGGWVVTFRPAHGGDTHRLHVAAESVPSVIPQSCGKAGKEAPLSYRLERHETVTAPEAGAARRGEVRS